MKKFFLSSGLAALSVTALFLSGCASLKTVNVAQDAGLSGASVTVDVVGVNDKNRAVETASIREYWQNGAALRNGMPFTTLRFGQGQEHAQSVTKEWSSLGATKVVVIADLPGVFADGVGANDARRKVIPVAKAKVVTVRVTPVGLSVDATK